MAAPVSAANIPRERVGPRWLRETFVPLSLILVCPPTTLLLWYAHTALGGSISALFSKLASDGVLQGRQLRGEPGERGA